MGNGNGDERANALGTVQGLSCGDRLVARERDGSGGDGAAFGADHRRGDEHVVCC